MKQPTLQLLGRLVLAIFLVAPFISKAVGKPNVLFIFADDQCYETIGALGLTDIDTPNLDRLVKRGTTFCAFAGVFSQPQTKNESLLHSSFLQQRYDVRKMNFHGCISMKQGLLSGPFHGYVHC